MNTRMKNALLTGIASVFTPTSMCFIDGEGEDGAGGGGSSAAEDDGDSSNASDDSELSTEEKLENEFYDPEDGSEDEEGSESEGGDEGEEDEGDEGEEGGDKKPADDKPKTPEEEAEATAKKTRLQERIDKLTSDARYNEREAEKWKDIAIKNGYVPGAEVDSTPLEEPDPDKYPYGEHDPEYLKDKGKHDAKVEIRQEQASARFQYEAASLDAKWTKNLAAKAEAYPDFSEVVEKGDWPCPPVIALAIKDSDVGPDLAYRLAKDRPEADRIAKLSPLEQAREFGRLESSFTRDQEITALKAEIEDLKKNGVPKPKEQPGKKIVSNAPAPPQRRVSGGGSRVDTPADTEDFKAFERMADKKLGLKGK